MCCSLHGRVRREYICVLWIDKQAGSIRRGPFVGAAFFWVDSFILSRSDDSIFTQRSSHVLWNICLSNNWFSYKALSVVPQIPLMPPASQQCAEWLRSYTGHCLRRDWPFWWTTAYMTTRYVQGHKRPAYWMLLNLAAFAHKTVMSDISQNESRLSSLDISG